MSITVLTYQELVNQDLTLFVDLIYNNFIELEEDDKLMHTKDKILENLKDKNSVVIVMLNNDKKIIGFVTASIMLLDDHRRVFYISYIYIAESERNKKLGSVLMEKSEELASKYKCNGIMLIFDTQQSNLVRFYENRGFMQDINLRRYERHDVYYKII